MAQGRVGLALFGHQLLKFGHLTRFAPPSPSLSPADGERWGEREGEGGGAGDQEQEEEQEEAEEDGLDFAG